MSQFLQDTFEATILTELMPRSQIDIYVQILQADGGMLLSACVHTLLSPWKLSMSRMMCVLSDLPNDVT